MKTFEITYHETYVRTYDIEANTPEEAEKILKERIREGMEDAPEECENSWCDNVQEITIDTCIGDVFKNTAIKHESLEKNDDGTFHSREYIYDKVHDMTENIIIIYDGTNIDYINKFIEYVENYDKFKSFTEWVEVLQNHNFKINDEHVKTVIDHLDYMESELKNIAKRLETLKSNNR